MISERKDLLLMALSIAAVAAVLALACYFRRETWLFWAALALAAPNILAFMAVPFVPAPMGVARDMVAAAGLKPGETVYDLGCGDGRVVYLAAKEPGVKGVGLELSPVVYLLARARGALWRSGAKIRLADFRRQDLSGADAVFCYLSPALMRALEPRLRAELKPGARVISYIYRFPNWKESRSAASEPGTIWVYEQPRRG